MGDYKASPVAMTTSFSGLEIENFSLFAKIYKNLLASVHCTGGLLTHLDYIKKLEEEQQSVNIYQICNEVIKTTHPIVRIRHFSIVKDLTTQTDGIVSNGPIITPHFPIPSITSLNYQAHNH